jgi:DNA end-binding protein Ku
MKAVWKGAISFGMVNIPVKLYTPTVSSKIEFHMLHSEDGGRIRYKRVCEKCGKELSRDEIVKGYEISKNEYVILTDDDLLKIPLRTLRHIDIRQFFSPSELGIVFYNGFYLISPDKGGEKAYHLLKKAMEDLDLMGIGKITMRNREYLVAVKPYENGLILIQLHFLEDMRNLSEVPGWNEVVEITDEELELAKKLLNAMKRPLRLEEFRDDYRNALMELISARIEGREVKVEEEITASRSLLDALKASLEVVGES